eukprot:3924769-Pyramimonas_sp.AAC.1
MGGAPATAPWCSTSSTRTCVLNSLVPLARQNPQTRRSRGCSGRPIRVPVSGVTAVDLVTQSRESPLH